MTTPHAPALRDDAPPAPRARRRAPLSLALAAALGATGLVPAAAAPAPERPAEDPLERRADAPTAPRATPSDEVQLGAPLAVVAAATGSTYTVRRGDTVSAIAARTGVSQRTIARANGLDGAGSIREGQVLRLTGTASSNAPAPSGGSTYTVRRGDTVSAIAARTGVSQRTIARANGLDAASSIREGQVLRLSGSSSASSGSSSAAPSGSTYTVRRGDTVSAIAARTGVSQRTIARANGLDAASSIREGQVLRLSGSSSASSGSSSAAPSGSTYTVRRGDTVSAIAARTGVSQRTIARANGLDAAGSIREGQVLRLTGTTTGSNAPASSGGGGTYTVRPGDSLSTVAAREGTTVAALRQVNPGVGADGLIRVGQRLSVPGGTAAPAPASSDPVASTFLGRSYPGATTQAATANRDALRARSVPSRDAMRALVRDTASRYGVDPSLAQAVAFQESGFDMRAVSPANAVGVMQVIPSSGAWAADLSGQSIDLLDPQDNVTAGVVILRQLLRSAPDTSTAIAGYYQGLGSVRSRGMFSDTRRYVANVQTLQAQYR